MKYLFIILLFFIFSCSSSYEVVHPYKNLSYSGERLFPVKTNNSEFTFRIWISNSTSIDRIISISKDSMEGFEGKLTEIGKIYNGRNSKNYYNEFKVIPKCGFLEFKKKLDKLNLMSMTDQRNFGIVFDMPFSTYVVEIKQKDSFNTFKFDTYYPNKGGAEDSYLKIENLLFEEFDIRKYFKLETIDKEQ